MPNHRKRPTGGIQAEDDALVGSARIVSLPPEKLRRARRVVAEHAAGFDDARELLLTRGLAEVER